MNIETGIKIPEFGKPDSGKYAWLNEMGPGDSVFVETIEECTRIRRMMRHYGVQHISRKMDGGFRIWLK
jgi:hypothetical protein